jgi:O-antigen/teichoic acid export membrane protein
MHVKPTDFRQARKNKPFGGAKGLSPALDQRCTGCVRLPASLRDRLLPIVLSQTVGLGCGLAGVKLTTRLIAPADYGTYGVFITFTPLGMWVVHAGLIKYVGRHWVGTSDQQGLLHTVFASSLRKLPWLALAVLAASFAMGGTPLLTWPLLFISATLMSIVTLSQTALQAERSHWSDFAVTSAGSISRSFGPPLLYAVAGGSLWALEGGFCLHTLVFAATGLWCLRHKLGTSKQASAPPLASVYEGPLFVSLAIAGWAAGAMNRWIVAAFFGPLSAGYFTLASNLSIIVTGMLSMVFVQFFQPSFFAAASEEPSARQELAQRVDRVAAGYWGLAILGIVLLHLAAPLLIGRLISENYRGALGWLLPAGGFGIAMSTGQFFHVMLLAGKREKGCGPVDFTAFALLAAGCLIAAFTGEEWFWRWLTVSPLMPWIVNRSLARHHYFRSPPAPCQ